MRNKILFVMLVLMLSPVMLFAQDRADAVKLYEAGKYNEAIKVCKAEIAEESNVVSYYVMGWCYLALRQYRTAIAEMNKALTVHGKHRKVLEILAEAHFRLGEYEKAEEFCVDYIKAAPDGERIGEIYYFLGEIFLRMKEYEHADISFSTALHYERNRSDWWTRLGICRQQAKNYSQAISAYNEALRLDAGNEAALKGRTECEKLLGA